MKPIRKTKDVDKYELKSRKIKKRKGVYVKSVLKATKKINLINSL